jgi:hypothetical protein
MIGLNEVRKNGWSFRYTLGQPVGQAARALSLYLTLGPEGGGHKTGKVTEKDGGSQRDEQTQSHTRARTNLVVLSI